MRISVFVTSYNQRRFLIEAIDSVLAQTMAPAQVIVVDDASTDGSQDVIFDYSRRYPELFTCIYHKVNLGVSKARISALKSIRGDYVTYVDGDDVFLPEKLALESDALKHAPEAKIAFSNNEYVSEDRAKFIRRWVDGEDVPQSNVFWQTFGRHFPRRSLFRMELVDYHAWKKIGFHDPGLGLYEDYDMRIRLTKYLNVVYVDKVLSQIRHHEFGLSNSNPIAHFYALDHIFKKNRCSLDSLPTYYRNMALAGFAEWVRPIGLRATRTALKSGKFRDVARMLWDIRKYGNSMLTRYGSYGK